MCEKRRRGRRVIIEIYIADCIIFKFQYTKIRVQEERRRRRRVAENVRNSRLGIIEILGFQSNRD